MPTTPTTAPHHPLFAAAGGGMSAARAATDTTAPQLTAQPRDGQAADAPLVFTFNEAIRVGSGSLTVNAPSGTVMTETLATSPYVTVSGNTLTFSPPLRLAYGTSYSLSFSPNAVLDLAGNAVAYTMYVSFRTGLSPVAVNLTGTADNDTLEGSNLADILDGRGGADTLYGHDGDDTLLGGDEQSIYQIDRLYGGAGNDTLRGGGGTDTLEGGAGDDRLYGDAGDDNLRGDTGDDLLEGGDGKDELSDSEGNNILRGGDGDDVLRSTGTGTLDGGAGNDRLEGEDGLAYVGGAGDDSIRADLWGRKAGATTIDGGDGADTVSVYLSGSNQASASANGGAGIDTYVLRATFSNGGIGMLRIDDFAAGSGGDRLDVRDLLSFRTKPGNPFDNGLLRLVADGGDTLLQRYSDVNPIGYATVAVLKGVAPSQLSGGNFVAGIDPHGGSAGLTISGTELADKLDGMFLDDTIFGLGGNDTIYGNGGNDSLDGGDGDDEVHGHEGNNTLRGGNGNDRLTTDGNGSNLLEGGAGNDRIEAGEGTDTLSGGSGNDELTVHGYGATAARAVTVLGGDGDDVLRFASIVGAAVRASGGAGADLFGLNFTEGMVTIADFGGTDRLDLSGLFQSQVEGNPFGALGYLRAQQQGAHLEIYADYDGAARGSYGERLVLVLENTQLSALSSNQFVGGYNPTGSTQGLHLKGTPQADTLEGQALDDTIEGGDGADIIRGGAGNDVLDGGDESVLGAGDTISGGTGDDTLRGGAGNDRLDGEDGNDQLTGGGGDDHLAGGRGDDTLDGGDGNDTLRDNSGKDILRGGAGNDHLIANGSGWDETVATGTLDGGDGDDWLEAGISTALALGGGGKDNISVDAGGTAATPLLRVDAGAGDDYLQIDAGWGNQRQVQVTGGAGSDTYRLGSTGGKPAVTVLDFQTGAGGDVIDVFNLGGLFAGNPFGAVGHARLVQDGSRVLYQWDADGKTGPEGFVTQLILENTRVGAFSAANFTQGARPDGANTGTTIRGGGAGDTLEGGRLDDILEGLGGDDKLDGWWGNDRLDGGDGNDSLLGGDGDDQLDGGEGKDILDGGAGNDVLRGGAGDDALRAEQGEDQLYGGAGNDSLVARYGGKTRLFGDAGNDELRSGGGGHLLDGGDGDDLLVPSGDSWTQASSEVVQVSGGNGNDTIRPENARNLHIAASGGAGRDLVVPTSALGTGSFTIADFTPGAGGDMIDVSKVAVANAGNPFGAGGSLRLLQRGADTVLQASSRNDDSSAFLDVLVLRAVDKGSLTRDNFVHGFNPDGSNDGYLIDGGDAGERLAGGWLDDRIDGHAGNDTLHGSAGNDHLSGGDGDDVLDGDAVDPATASGLYAWPLGRNDDRLDGGAGQDLLISNGGNDILLGGAGNDIFQVSATGLPASTTARYHVELDGGEGNDRIRLGLNGVEGITVNAKGGAGVDTYEFARLLDDGAYTILDFQAGAGGDVLDMFEALGFLRQNPFASGLFRLEQRGADTVVQYDLDAANPYYEFTDLVTLKNVGKDSLTAANMRYGHAPDGTPVSLGPLVEGGAGADRIDGDARPNQLHGNEGKDVLAGYGGNDFLHGGDGLDTAIFRGTRADYQRLNRGDGDFLVSDLRAGANDGKDWLYEVERLVFSDGAIALDTGIQDVAGQAYRIYRAAFDRAADETGLGFWMAMMDGGVALVDIAGGFVRSQEFTDLYGAAPTHAEIVTRMYTNILDRAPEQAGYDYWLKALNDKLVGVAEMLAMFSESAENRAAVAGLIGNGVAYQPYGS